MQLLEHLKWRYATKKFDTSKKVSPQDIESIKESIQLSATSYGLQPFKVLDIKNPALREELKPLSWNQAQITDASHLFIFCSANEVTGTDVDEMMQLRSDVNNIPLENLVGYGEFVKGKLKEKTAVEMPHWTAKQAYLALSNAITACAELKIDCTPMEGFEMNEINEKLQLKEKGLNVAAFLAIGYRHSEDQAQNAKKVRKPMTSLFEDI